MVLSQRVLYHSLIGLNIRTIDYADVYKDRKKNVYSRASIPEATVIPISAIFPLVTDAYRSACAQVVKT